MMKILWGHIIDTDRHIHTDTYVHTDTDTDTNTHICTYIYTDTHSLVLAMRTSHPVTLL